MALPLSTSLPGCRKLRCEPQAEEHEAKLTSSQKAMLGSIEKRVAAVTNTPPNPDESGLTINCTPPDGAKVDRKTGKVVALTPDEFPPAEDIPGRLASVSAISPAIISR
jgi:hypothetical protein